VSAPKVAALGVLALPAVVFLMLAGVLAGATGGGGACGAAPASGVEAVNVRAVAGLNADQLHNAGTVIAVGQQMGFDVRGQTIGVMVALGESGLVNIDVGDAAGPDSRGLFQQRAEGWGTYAERMDPATASRSFYQALQKVPGWEAMSPTGAAHTVQRNADPNYYTRYFAEAGQIVANATGQVAAAAAPVTACPAASLAATVTGTDPGPGPQGVDHLVPRMIALRATVQQQFPEFTDIGCWRASDPFPDHPSGRACDFMVPGGGHDAAGNASGDKLAEWVNANAGPLGVQYEIWQQRYRPAGKDWAPMADRGGWTANHMDHVHVTVLGLIHATYKPPLQTTDRDLSTYSKST